MLKDRQSKLVHYGIGIAVEDKPRKSDTAKITNIEEFPFTEGKLADEKDDLKHELPDKQGIPRKSKASRDIVIEATWLGGYDSNRMTSPDLVKNESVDIYRYADTQEYYWRKRGREPGIRRLETVCYMYGNLQKPLEKWDKRSSYWHEISTHDKHIVTQTSASDGEKFMYVSSISPAKGSIYSGDDTGNYSRVSSNDSLVESHNANDTFHQLLKDNYLIGANESLVMLIQTMVSEAVKTYINGDLHVTGTLHVDKIECNEVNSSALKGPLSGGSGSPDLVLPSYPDKVPHAVAKDEFYNSDPPK